MSAFDYIMIETRNLLAANPKLSEQQAFDIAISGKDLVSPEEIMAKVVAAGGFCEVLRNGHFQALTPEGESIEFIASPTGQPFIYSCSMSEGVAYAVLKEMGISKPPKTAEEIAADLATADTYWREAIPLTGTLGEAYLRDHRRITIPLDCVAFHAGLRALIARRQLPDGTPRGLIITYLTPDGRRDWRKDFGPKAGGVAVRLAQAGPKLLVGEGLETVASFMQRTGLPGWCCGSANDLKAVHLPPSVREVLILQDNDVAGRRAANDLYWRCRSERRMARIFAPPEPFNDWNDHHVAN
jgi:hypothetical protein